MIKTYNERKTDTNNHDSIGRVSDNLHNISDTHTSRHNYLSQTNHHVENSLRYEAAQIS